MFSARIKTLVASIDFVLRPALQADVPAIAVLFRRVRQLRLPYLPDLHSAEDDLAFFGGLPLAGTTIWVAETNRVVGFIAWTPGWIDHLYVDADYLGMGIGSALIAKVMDSHERLELWAFQKNTAAIGFYISKGFRVMQETDGAGNEEHEPDVLMAWSKEL